MEFLVYSVSDEVSESDLAVLLVYICSSKEA